MHVRGHRRHPGGDGRRDAARGDPRRERDANRSRDGLAGTDRRVRDAVADGRAAGRRPTPSAAWIYDPAADPAADIEAALALARSDGKPVLIDFGADWCPDCVVLARMFELPSFADYLAGVHVVRIDVGTWDHNLDVSKEYGNPILAGIPAVVLVAPDGKVLGSTADGRLASAASMTPEAVLAVLRSLGG